MAKSNARTHANTARKGLQAGTSVVVAKVTLVCTFEVPVEVSDATRLTAMQLERAIRDNWDVIYKHRARWSGGDAPQLTGTLMDVSVPHE
jgi:hypothetical protein